LLYYERPATYAKMAGLCRLNPSLKRVYLARYARLPSIIK
jgi:hypothetical protein